MSDVETTTTETAPAAAAPQAPAAPAASAPAKKATGLVTSDKTIDFPEFGWGIHAGEERELPSDPDAAAAVLSNEHISKV